MKNWHVQNHSARLDKVDFMIEAPTGPEDMFRFANFLSARDKLSNDEKQLLDWRAEGYTYSEIQKMTGASNLSIVRKKCMDLVSQIEAE